MIQSATPAIPTNTADVRTTRPTAGQSFAPYACATRMFDAVVSPVAMEVRKKKTGQPTVIAAMASVPSPLPTQIPFTTS